MKIKIKIKTNLDKVNQEAVEKNNSRKLKAIRNIERILECIDDTIEDKKLISILNSKKSLVNLEAIDMIDIEENYADILIEEESILNDLLKIIAEEL